MWLPRYRTGLDLQQSSPFPPLKRHLINITTYVHLHWIYIIIGRNSSKLKSTKVLLGAPIPNLSAI